MIDIDTCIKKTMNNPVGKIKKKSNFIEF